jgi:hypothetical protein
MKTEWTDVVQAIAAIAGVVVALGGFVIIIYQIVQLERAVRGDTHSKLYSQGFEVVRFFADNAEVRPYFYEGKPVTGAEPEYGKISLCAELMADYLEHIALQKPNLPEDVWLRWVAYIRDRLRSSPFLVRYLQTHKDQYSEELHVLVPDDKGGALGK